MKSIGGVTSALALVVALSVAPTAHAAAAEAGGQQPSTLGATTVITGRNAATVDVRLTTPAVWSGDSSDVRITGGGELPGFVLTKQTKSVYNHPLLGRLESRYEDVVASAVRLPKSGVTKDLSAEDRTLLMMPMKTVIEPGVYRLYLVAGGSPVKIELELKGLLGTTRITPTDRTGIDMKRLPERTSLRVPAENLFTAGDDAKLERTGFIFDALVVELKGSPEGEFGSCVYRGQPLDEEDGEEVSYGPHCIGGAGRDSVSSSFHYTTTFMNEGYGVMWGMVSGLERDDWTLSTWYRGTGTIGKAAAFGFWLNSK